MRDFIEELKETIVELQEKNTVFKNKVSELEQIQRILYMQLQDDRSEAFNRAFEGAKVYWWEFASMLDGYIQSLQNMNQVYEEIMSTQFKAFDKAIDGDEIWKKDC